MLPEHLHAQITTEDTRMREAMRIQLSRDLSAEQEKIAIDEIMSNHTSAVRGIVLEAWGLNR